MTDYRRLANNIKATGCIDGNDWRNEADMLRDIASGKLVVVPAEPTEVMLKKHPFLSKRIYCAMLAIAQEKT